MKRTTSAEAHRKNIESGYLSRKQRQVFDFLKINGSMTGEELGQKSGIPGAWKRLSELAKFGVIAPVGNMLNRSGHKAIVWGITGFTSDDLPGITIPRLKPRKQLMEQISYLEAQVDKLNRQLSEMSACSGRPLYFFTLEGVKEPSAYYHSIEALRESTTYKMARGEKIIWTGSHEAPLLYDEPEEDTSVNKRSLPDGMTCGVCNHYDRCERLFRCRKSSVMCDYFPSMFIKKEHK